MSGLRNDRSVGRLQPLHDPQHSRRVPRTAFGGRLLSRFQFAGDGAGRHALGDTFRDNRGERFGARVSGRPIGRGKVFSTIPSKPRATGFGGLQGGFGAGLSRSCSATAARICSVSRVACGLSTAMNSMPEFHERGYKGQVAGQTVELCDH